MTDNHNHNDNSHNNNSSNNNDDDEDDSKAEEGVLDVDITNSFDPDEVLPDMVGAHHIISHPIIPSALITPLHHTFNSHTLITSLSLSHTHYRWYHGRS